MKLLIASDIHGDAVCCKKMLDAAETNGVDKIVILGDILYHGPRNDLPENYAPKKVIEMLNQISEKLLCVKGNCEAEVDQMVLCFPVMNECAWIYDNACKISMYLSHGHKHNPENLPPLPCGTVFLYGHTHLLGFTEKDGILCLNPGSVSLPKGGNARSYALYEDGSFSIVSLDGEVIDTRKVHSQH